MTLLIPTPAPSLLPFASSEVAQVFHFEHEGQAAPLREHLIGRYRYGRSAQWRETFYPGRVRLNGQPVGAETVVQPGDTVAYLHLRAEEPPPAAPLAVLYEDETMLVLHKPDDVPVSPSGQYFFTSLAIRAREDFANPELTPIHRLDLETSGPLIFAKRARDLKRFHRLFTAKTLRKEYRALALGCFPDDVREIAGRIVPAAGSAIHTKLALEPGDVAHSLTRILHLVHHAARPGAPECTEVALEPVTGKTNQLRVHLAHIGHSIVGDKKYHPDEGVFLDWLEHRDFARVQGALWLPRQALQCQALEFAHPLTNETLRIEALPASWTAKLHGLVRPALGA